MSSFESTSPHSAHALQVLDDAAEIPPTVFKSLNPYPDALLCGSADLCARGNGDDIIPASTKIFPLKILEGLTRDGSEVTTAIMLILNTLHVSNYHAHEQSLLLFIAIPVFSTEFYHFHSRYFHLGNFL